MRQASGDIMESVSLGANAVSDPIDLQQEWMFAISAVWTGTPVGNFTIEICCDEGAIQPDGTITGLTNWITYTGSTQAAGGGSGMFCWLIANYPAYWARLKYTSSSSTGTVNARFNAKGF